MNFAASICCVLLVLPNIIFAENVVDILAADPRFSTLVTAVVQADLVEALQGDGPFTVLAPTDTAFESVDVGGLIANKTELTRVLTRHVIAAKVYAADVGTGPIETLGGEIIQGATEGTGDNIKVTFAFGKTVANVIEANIEASNGIIHVLDQVL